MQTGELGVEQGPDPQLHHWGRAPGAPGSRHGRRLIGQAAKLPEVEAAVGLDSYQSRRQTRLSGEVGTLDPSQR